MAPNILTVPLEILIEMVSYLHPEDFISLRSTRMVLLERLAKKSIGCEVVKKYFLYSTEAELAQRGKISYFSAIQRVIDRRKALAMARPYSIVVLDVKDVMFCYSQGVVCNVQKNTIRILDMFGGCQTEVVVDMQSLIAREAHHWPLHLTQLKEFLKTGFNMLLRRYEYGLLYLDLTSKNKPSSALFATIVVRKDVSYFCERIDHILMIRKPRPRPQLITDGRFLITASGDYDEDGEGWLLTCNNLEDSKQPEPGFHFREIQADMPDWNIVFKLHEGWIYILTTCHKDVDRDRDSHPGSHYYCYRFPLDDFYPLTFPASSDRLHFISHKSLPARLEIIKWKRTVWPERTADEGGWLRLSICNDEQTGRLYAVEESNNINVGDGKGSSCFEFHYLNFPKLSTPTVMSPMTRVADIVQPMALEKPIGRISPHPCPSYENDHTVLRSYVYASDSVINLLDHGANDTDLDSRIHLSIHACTGASSIRPTMGTADEQKEDGNRSVNYNQHRFPPQNAPKELVDLLNPFSHDWTAMFTYRNDERFIFLLYRSEFCRSEQVILVNFDPQVRFPGLKKMALTYDGTPSRDRATPGDTPEKTFQETLSEWLESVGLDEAGIQARIEEDDAEIAGASFWTGMANWRKYLKGYEFTWSSS